MNEAQIKKDAIIEKLREMSNYLDNHYYPNTYHLDELAEYVRHLDYKIKMAAAASIR